MNCETGLLRRLRNGSGEMPKSHSAQCQFRAMQGATYVSTNIRYLWHVEL